MKKTKTNDTKLLMIVHTLLISQTTCAQLLNRFSNLKKKYGFYWTNDISNEFLKNWSVFTEERFLMYWFFINERDGTCTKD